MEIYLLTEESIWRWMTPDGIGDTGRYTLPYNQQVIAADKLKLNQIILSQNHNS